MVYNNTNSFIFNNFINNKYLNFKIDNVFAYGGFMNKNENLDKDKNM